MKKYISFILLAAFLLSAICLTGCDWIDSLTISSDDENEDVKLTFEAMLYDNQGNNYVTFKGNSFNITPNKQKQWGYDTNGSWISWYETSSVVSIDIDGHPVDTCGSTVLFKDSRIEIKPLTVDIGILDSSDESGYTANINDSVLKNYFALTNWWFDTHEKGQGKSRIILIQSQDGYNIGVVEGAEVYWEVSENLPKTTLLKIDDKPLYIHRCNFTIIDTALFNNVVMPTE
ncbi:MAG: DUF5052 family protein [Ruminococcus sp.]|nr:DUF5052 family protein [Ruminococcus sp.]